MTKFKAFRIFILSFAVFLSATSVFFVAPQKAEAVACGIGAISGKSNVFYDFNSDTAGSAPSAVTARSGSFEVKNNATFGNSFHPTGDGAGPFNNSAVIAVASFDNVSQSSTDMVATWKHLATSSWDRNGILLRYSVSGQTAYMFQLLTTTAKIYKMNSTSVTELASVTLNSSNTTPRYYKASVQGTSLEFCYSDDYGLSYTRLTTVTDATYSTGGAGFAGGFASGDETVNILDNIQVDYKVPGASTIAISSPVIFQSFQQGGGSTASIPVSGTYTGSPTNIEYRVDSGSWSTLASSPSGGTFSGTITGVSAGQHSISVRFSNSTSITGSVAAIRVGDVFGWIGQSNQENRMTNIQSYTGSYASIYDEDGVWKNLQTGYKSPGSPGYSTLPLLSSLIEGTSSKPVAFVAETQGGTGLLAPDANWTKGGTNYNAFITTVQNSGVNSLKAFLWYQGERDIVNGNSNSAYRAGESTMLDNLQADTGFTGVKLVSAMPANYSTETSTTIDPIRLAKIYNWENDADVLPGPTGHDQSFADGVHWSSDAQALTLSNRWWRVIKAAFYSGTESARGPRFSSATYLNNQITVTFTGGSGNLTNQTDKTGWSVTDGAGARTVSSSTGTSNTVTLTLDQSLTAPVTVSFASGNNAELSTLKDSGTYPLPPEPIISQSASLQDVVNPTVSSLSPTDNATGVSSTANLVINFSEAVSVQTGNITIKKTSDNTTVETIDVTSGLVTGTGTSTITINPSSTLGSSIEYYILIDSTAFDDLAGNSYAGIASTTAWSFTTSDTTAPTIVSIVRSNPISQLTKSISLVFEVIFSKDMVDFDDLSDVELATTGTASGSIGSISAVSGSIYDVSVSSVSGTGTLGINLTSTSATTDAALNDLSSLTPDISDENYIIDNTNPVITITAPTKNSSSTISDTTVNVTDDHGISSGDVAVSPSTTAGVSNFSCSQTSSTEVDCTLDITSSGDLVISADDSLGNTDSSTESGYIISTPAPAPTTTTKHGSYQISKKNIKNINVPSAPIILPDVNTKNSCSFEPAKLGSKGENVKNIQTFLSGQKLLSGKADGVFGKITEAAVKKFQVIYRSEILDPSGIKNPTGWFYPKTIEKALKLCK